MYAGLPDVEVWDEARDARLYAGPWPVVAHPPCARWCQLASVNEKRWGALIGDDGGTFAAALVAVRKFGGVLEHPAYSLAWDHFGLPKPTTRGGWTQSFDDPGYVTEVSQVAYGALARKRTWLYYIGDAPADLCWGEPFAIAQVGGRSSHPNNKTVRLQHGASAATPEAFRDVLLAMARTASQVPA